MITNERTVELLEQMERNSRRQVLYARVQTILSIVAAGCCLALLFCGVKILPRLQNAAQQVETVLANLETVTAELAESDLSGMVENVDALVSNVDGLVSTSQDGVEQMIAKLNGIDFEALNQAIQDLSAVIEPIANFFNTFKLR